ncbi:hypothetical protein BC940DRAFT_333613 [Gongronella butleri]|nr:hypothetical protein BC940DRAFT_333613 [Gongronella butleri]
MSFYRAQRRPSSQFSLPVHGSMRHETRHASRNPRLPQRKPSSPALSLPHHSSHASRSRSARHPSPIRSAYFPQQSDGHTETHDSFPRHLAHRSRRSSQDKKVKRQLRSLEKRMRVILSQQQQMSLIFEEMAHNMSASMEAVDRVEQMVASMREHVCLGVESDALATPGANQVPSYSHAIPAATGAQNDELAPSATPDNRLPSSFTMRTKRDGVALIKELMVRQDIPLLVFEEVWNDLRQIGQCLYADALCRGDIALNTNLRYMNPTLLSSLLDTYVHRAAVIIGIDLSPCHPWFTKQLLGHFCADRRRIWHKKIISQLDDAPRNHDDWVQAWLASQLTPHAQYGTQAMLESLRTRRATRSNTHLTSSPPEMQTTPVAGPSQINSN